MTNFGDFQLEIYSDGLSGVRPALPIGYAALEARAAAALSPEILAYVAGGAGNEHTQRANVAAFDRLGLIPRMLAGAAERDLSVELFGIKLPTPLLLAPIGVIGLCAQDGHGDLATARAAARTGVPMIASTLTVDPLEQVAGELGETPGFFQLYTPADRELAASFVLQRISETMCSAKQRHRGLPASLMQDANLFVPPALFARAARVTSRLMATRGFRAPVNVVISNVPGSPQRLYAAGAKQRATYPVSAVMDGVGLNFTVLSYRDQLGFGIVADREQLNDPWPLLTAIRDTLTELQAHAADGEAQSEPVALALLR